MHTDTREKIKNRIPQRRCGFLVWKGGQFVNVMDLWKLYNGYNDVQEYSFTKESFPKF